MSDYFGQAMGRAFDGLEKKRDRTQRGMEGLAGGVAGFGQALQKESEFARTHQLETDKFEDTKLNSASTRDYQASVTEANRDQLAVEQLRGTEQERAESINRTEQLAQAAQEAANTAAEFQNEVDAAIGHEEQARLRKQAETAEINAKNALAEYHRALANESRIRASLLGMEDPDNDIAREVLSRANTLTIIGESSDLTSQVINALMADSQGLANLVEITPTGEKRIKFLEPSDDHNIGLNRRAISLWVTSIQRDRDIALREYDSAMGDSARDADRLLITDQYDAAVDFIYDSYRRIHSPTPQNQMQTDRITAFNSSQAVAVLSERNLDPMSLEVTARGFFGTESQISIQSINAGILNDLNLSDESNKQRVRTMVWHAITSSPDSRQVAQVRLLRETMRATGNTQGLSYLDSAIRDMSSAATNQEFLQNSGLSTQAVERARTSLLAPIGRTFTQGLDPMNGYNQNSTNTNSSEPIPQFRPSRDLTPDQVLQQVTQSLQNNVTQPSSTMPAYIPPPNTITQAQSLLSQDAVNLNPTGARQPQETEVPLPHNRTRIDDVPRAPIVPSSTMPANIPEPVQRNAAEAFSEGISNENSTGSIPVTPPLGRGRFPVQRPTSPIQWDNQLAEFLRNKPPTQTTEQATAEFIDTFGPRQ